MTKQNNSNKKYDVILFGATGFTGSLVAEYLALQYPENSDIHWAIAGRNITKLEAVRDQIGAHISIDLIIADVEKSETLKALADQTKVIISTVGPYQLYGNEIIEACVNSGTSYVDLCGEPAWMRHAIDTYAERAKASGARIVFSCGFDSIPFDMGVYYLQNKSVTTFGKPCIEVKTLVRKMVAPFSGGTVASFKATMKSFQADPKMIALFQNPFALTPGFDGPAQPAGDKPKYDTELESWLAPLMIGPINTKNVHRSNLLMDHQYGKGFLYSEMVIAGKGNEGKARADSIANDKSIAGDDVPNPGEGPSKEVRDAAGTYEILFVGKTIDGDSISTVVTGDRDPGYGSTARMIAEAAICLSLNTKTVGGIWTTAPALGEPLLERLTKYAGLEFKVEATSVSSK